MTAWLRREDWWRVPVVVGVVVLLAALAGLTFSGARVAVDLSGQVEPRGWAVTVLSVCLAAVVLLVVVAAYVVGAALLVTFVDRQLDRWVRADSQPWEAFLALSGAGLLGVAAQLWDGRPVVALAVAALGGLAAFGAARLLHRAPVLGLALYLAVPVLATVAAVLVGEVDVVGWAASLGPLDLAALVVVAAVYVVLPLVVRAVQRRAPQQDRRAARLPTLRPAVPG